MERPEYIRGNPKCPDKVLKTLYDLGGKNPSGNGSDFPALYFVNPNGNINFTNKGSMLYDMLIEYGVEIFPEPDFKYNVGDKVIQNKTGIICEVKESYSHWGYPEYRVESPIEGEFSVPEPELSPYVEKPQFQPYEKVLVRDHAGHVWCADLFSHFVSNNSAWTYVCVGGLFDQCIPYVGNEQLLGTTDNPK